VPHVGDLHSSKEDDMGYHHVLLHLGSIFDGFLTYSLLYHGYFMYYDLICRACK
jgi:hypothetical protein